MSDERGYIRRVDGLHRAGRLVIEWDGAEDSTTDRTSDVSMPRAMPAFGGWGWRSCASAGPT
ncbi:MAG: hypothetical protein R2711_07510 [Acidimicrobiales bacterium]